MNYSATEIPQSFRMLLLHVREEQNTGACHIHFNEMLTALVRDSITMALERFLLKNVWFWSFELKSEVAKLERIQKKDLQE